MDFISTPTIYDNRGWQTHDLKSAFLDRISIYLYI